MEDGKKSAVPETPLAKNSTCPHVLSRVARENGKKIVGGTNSDALRHK